LVAICLFGLLSQARATEQMSYSFLVKTNGVWQLWNDYLNGAALVIENDEKHTKVVLSVNELLPKEEVDRTLSTAGPAWGTYSLWYFAELDGRKMFRVRTQHGSDILIALENAAAIPPGTFSNQLRELDVSQITSILKHGQAILESDEHPAIVRLQGAILHAAGYGLTNCISYIRPLEATDYEDARGFLHGPDPAVDHPPVPERYWKFTQYTTRRFAALALRRLGGVPQGFPAIGIFPQDATNASDLPGRAVKVSGLRHGQVPKSVYQLLGPPDYIENAYREEDGKVTLRVGAWSGAWRYDVDGDSPCSILVIWDSNGTISKVERFTPPLWQGDALISDGSVKPVFRPNGSIGRAMQLYGKAFTGKMEPLVVSPAISQPSAAPNAAPLHR
jgi:hypothetical protein